ncbi:hypothetical protein D6C99_06119 [Aureobasidium pullulans]|uniref:LPXTG-domain-containing protein n=1 Tax=Aureobasidium pullulans TaxID=5580 RepID=A0A4S9BGK8_AURPU|nr:hypothetical protein D6D15_03198 [Aureobasidium pullulans]THY46404.1 hypothetical protein D6C99_06119 [Aureobasidium pullulans]
MSSTQSPLTTRTSPMSGVFTPPSSCSSHWTYESQAANDVTGGLLIQRAQAGTGREDPSCYPRGLDGWGRAPSFIQVFSPGVCPSGYTTANNGYNGDTTTAVCCSSKFGYTNFISTVNAGGVTAQYFGCTSIFTDASATTVFAEDGGEDVITSSMDGTTTFFTEVSGLITMWAQPITVAFQQRDLSLFTTSLPSTSSASSTTTSESSTTKTSSESVTSTSVSSTLSMTTGDIPVINSSSRLPALASSTSTTSPTDTPSFGPSTGAIAGIVVGAVAALAFLIGAVILFRRRRNRAQPSNSWSTMEIQTSQAGHSGPAKSDYGRYEPSLDMKSLKRPAEL